MANCGTCGNSSGLPCGCSQSSLTTSCYPEHFSCSSFASRCAEAYCMECVQPCTKEDLWAIELSNGNIFQAGKNDSLTQIFQQFLLAQTVDANTFNTNLIPLFYVNDINTTSIQFAWLYAGTTVINGFQIQFRAYSDNNWSVANFINNPNATSLTVNISNLGLTSGIQYVFQINTIENGNVTNTIQAVDVYVTIP